MKRNPIFIVFFPFNLTLLQEEQVTTNSSWLPLSSSAQVSGYSLHQSALFLLLHYEGASGQQRAKCWPETQCAHRTDKQKQSSNVMVKVEPQRRRENFAHRVLDKMSTDNENPVLHCIYFIYLRGNNISLSCWWNEVNQRGDWTSITQR